MVGLKSSTDTDILLSIETLIDYAKANGKPLVINISLGSNDGPHDGSSVNDQYYAKLGKEAFICIAAGNEGDLPIAAYHKFSSTNTEMRGLFDTTDPTYGNTLSGAVEFWGDQYAQTDSRLLHRWRNFRAHIEGHRAFTWYIHKYG